MDSHEECFRNKINQGVPFDSLLRLQLSLEGQGTMKFTSKGRTFPTQALKSCLMVLRHGENIEKAWKNVENLWKTRVVPNGKRKTQKDPKTTGGRQSTLRVSSDSPAVLRLRSHTHHEDQGHQKISAHPRPNEAKKPWLP